MVRELPTTQRQLLGSSVAKSATGSTNSASGLYEASTESPFETRLSALLSRQNPVNTPHFSKTLASVGKPLLVKKVRIPSTELTNTTEAVQQNKPMLFSAKTEKQSGKALAPLNREGLAPPGAEQVKQEPYAERAVQSSSFPKNTELTLPPADASIAGMEASASTKERQTGFGEEDPVDENTVAATVVGPFSVLTQTQLLVMPSQAVQPLNLPTETLSSVELSNTAALVSFQQSGASAPEVSEKVSSSENLSSLNSKTFWQMQNAVLDEPMSVKEDLTSQVSGIQSAFKPNASITLQPFVAEETVLPPLAQQAIILNRPLILPKDNFSNQLIEEATASSEVALNSSFSLAASETFSEPGTTLNPLNSSDNSALEKMKSEFSQTLLLHKTPSNLMSSDLQPTGRASTETLQLQPLNASLPEKETIGTFSIQPDSPVQAMKNNFIDPNPALLEQNRANQAPQEDVLQAAKMLGLGKESNIQKTSLALPLSAKVSAEKSGEETNNKLKIEENASSAPETVSNFENDPAFSSFQLGQTVPIAAPSNSVSTVLQPSTEVAPVLSQVMQGLETGLQQNRSSVTLQLNPDELGQVKITLTSKGPGIVEARMVVGESTTHQLLSSHQQQLQEALKQQGIQLASMQVRIASTSEAALALNGSQQSFSLENTFQPAGQTLNELHSHRHSIQNSLQAASLQANDLVVNRADDSHAAGGHTSHQNTNQEEASNQSLFQNFKDPSNAMLSQGFTGQNNHGSGNPQKAFYDFMKNPVPKAFTSNFSPISSIEAISDSSIPQKGGTYVDASGHRRVSLLA